MRTKLLPVLLILVVAPLALVAAGHAQAPASAPAQAPSPAQASAPVPVDPDTLSDPVGTFSVLGYDPVTGEMGGAVQSRVFSVGNGVLWGEAEVGVVATQAIVDVSYGPQSLALLRQGVAPKDVIQRVLDADTDPGYGRQAWPKAGRQFAVMNAKGEFAAYTGPEASVWAGDRQGKNVTAQGNILARPQVVENMVEAFEATETNTDGSRNHLAFRLIAALEAGAAFGGDTRGQQSAAILIVKKNCGVWLHNDVVLRLQVDNDPTPIQKMRENVQWWWENQRRKRPNCPE
ncbi:MAG: DUF1028 domain-containing protein [Vicinamibacterales bacterium]